MCERKHEQQEHVPVDALVCIGQDIQLRSVRGDRQPQWFPSVVGADAVVLEAIHASIGRDDRKLGKFVHVRILECIDNLRGIHDFIRRVLLGVGSGGDIGMGFADDVVTSMSNRTLES